MDEIEARLRQARELIDKAELPTDLRAVGFRWVLNQSAQSAAAPGSKRGGEGEHDAATRWLDKSGGASLDRAATRLNITAAELDRLFAVEGDKIATTIPPSRLSQTKRPAMRELILATAAVRQAGGWEAETNVQGLREICEEYGSRYFDGNNYNNAVNGLADELRKVPSPQGLALKVTPTGYASAAILLKRLAAGEQLSK